MRETTSSERRDSKRRLDFLYVAARRDERTQEFEFVASKRRELVRLKSPGQLRAAVPAGDTRDGQPAAADGTFQIQIVGSFSHNIQNIKR